MKNIKTVEIIYDVFAEKSVITIDRMPLQKFSKILKYQNLPFPEWFPNIFDAIREEINEEYEINFSCFEYEQEVFSFYANQKNIPVKLKSYELDDSIILRLKKFNILCMGGLSIDRIPDISIPIFTDKFSDLLYDIKLPKLSFCKISFDIKPMSELSKFKQFKIIITDENSVYDNSVVINIGKNLGFQGNNRYCCDKDNFNNLILKILNGRFFTDIFKNLIQENFKNNLYYNSFIPLFKISPIINIDIPKNIGMNEKKSLTVTTIPDNSKKPELLLNISPDNILTWENEKLIGLNAGECFVEVYNKENNQLSAKEKVRVYERNPVRKISFKQKEITISQDVFVQLEINFEPETADNITKIKFSSSNESVIKAGQTNGGIYSVAPGIATIKVECEDVFDTCKIIVKSKLKDIKINFSDNRPIQKNTVRKINIEPIPENALLNNLTINIIPEDIATYDGFTNSLKLIDTGNCTVIVSNDEFSKTGNLHIEKMFKFEIGE